MKPPRHYAFRLVVLCFAVVAGCRGAASDLRTLRTHPMLFERRVDLVLASDLRGVVERGLAGPVDALSARERIVLQNDLWGLVQRLRSASSGSDVEPLLALAHRGVKRLALHDDVLEAHDGVRHPPRHPLLEGMPEKTTEHVSLSHERLFGMRRLFRIFIAPDRRALMSQLVALDRNGRPRLTDVVGEIEMLALGTQGVRTELTPLAARVLHLDRVTTQLHEVEHVSQVPDRGALGVLFEASPPAMLADFPCGQCHDDGSMMSLPMDGEPWTRFAGLLDDVEYDAVPFDGVRGRHDSGVGVSDRSRE